MLALGLWSALLVSAQAAQAAEADCAWWSWCSKPSAHRAFEDGRGHQIAESFSGGVSLLQVGPAEVVRAQKSADAVPSRRPSSPSKDAASSNALVQFYRELVEEQEVTPGEVSGVIMLLGVVIACLCWAPPISSPAEAVPDILPPVTDKDCAAPAPGSETQQRIDMTAPGGSSSTIQSSRRAHLLLRNLKLDVKANRLLHCLPRDEPPRRQAVNFKMRDTMYLVVLLVDAKDVIPRAEKDVQALGYAKDKGHGTGWQRDCLGQVALTLDLLSWHGVASKAAPIKRHFEENVLSFVLQAVIAETDKSVLQLAGTTHTRMAEPMLKGAQLQSVMLSEDLTKTALLQLQMAQPRQLWMSTAQLMVRRQLPADAQEGPVLLDDPSLHLQARYIAYRSEAAEASSQGPGRGPDNRLSAQEKHRQLLSEIVSAAGLDGGQVRLYLSYVPSLASLATLYQLRSQKGLYYGAR
eukprot:s165_g37.t1